MSFNNHSHHHNVHHNHYQQHDNNINNNNNSNNTTSSSSSSSMMRMSATTTATDNGNGISLSPSSSTTAVGAIIGSNGCINHNNNNNNNNNNNGTFLCDISNLTAEERNKLDEIRQKRQKLLNEIQKLKEEISFVKKEMSRLDHHPLQQQQPQQYPQSNSIIDGSSNDHVNNNNGNGNQQRLKQLSIGKKKFNMDPKKGIEFLIAQNLVGNTPEDVARFLYKGESLNKTAIGTYLGEKIDFNLKVLNHFIELHDFKDSLLVQALRQFLWSFRLPGEAQKIDRMMEKFAAHYCHQNPGVFSNTDTCFVLSFSIIMLNTSLHNPNVKEKMTADKFIQMNRGINNGGDLPKELLLSLYENIRHEPFKIPEDDGQELMHTFFDPDREGWLWKQGGRYKSWKRRWFLLNDKCLYYFECDTDKEPRGIIPLENVDIREIGDRGGRQHCFELYSPISDVIKACKTDTEGRVIEGRHSVYRLSAATAVEKDAWVKSIQTSVSRNPFYEMLAARKRKAQQN
ncbi:Cytohesin-1 [Dermatophagoides pteronyssinus]|uniref:Cytohesin-1 n=2 Tax=Dermatophagoides pteronyssinus TaxID=6956 RepID=A0ABQ8IZ19_DERPT|nr:cytohesin-1-like [Dermatophagoides pteronyssinus]KAH9415543.1 Cytohesin-1 [Dermatophagoides pteronyssinus]